MLRRGRFSLPALAAAALLLVAARCAETPRAGKDPPTLTFLAVGDWGRGGAGGQREVAAAMANFADKTPAKFVVSTGDNFYENGVASVEDPEWKRSFEDIYARPSLMIPWYVALGNHDYHGDVGIQIAYTKTSTRWRMPARYYTATESASPETRVELFCLDTCPFLGEYRTEGSITRVQDQDPAAQMIWLRNALAASTAPWKVVFGHHAVFSVGPHGDSPELIRTIKPLLEKYGVQAYLNGHDHSLQVRREGSVVYFTSGGGSSTTPVKQDARAEFAESVSGFMAFTLTGDRMTVDVRDAANRTLHTTVVRR
jgi:tartrate-resistant acid phosphatase type 5